MCIVFRVDFVDFDGTTAETGVEVKIWVEGRQFGGAGGW